MCRDKQKRAEASGPRLDTTLNGSAVVEDLVRALLDGSDRAAARIITLVENKDPLSLELMRAIYPHTGNSHVIGITGASGTGKSTLTDVFAAQLRERRHTVGIIAVDPSSPHAGGALLGDRIRMQRLSLDPGVFIRSMATRGNLGGLAQTTSRIVKVLDAFGKDFILIETVGAGQDEVGISGTADTTLLVLTPGSGDAIQNMKTGIMEIADIYVINMADREGADQLFSQVKMRADQDSEVRKNDWQAPILLTEANNNKGVAELADAVESHRRFLADSGRMQRLRREKTKNEILHLINDEITERLLSHIIGERSFDDLIDEVASRSKDPYTVVDEIVRKILAKRE